MNNKNPTTETTENKLLSNRACWHKLRSITVHLPEFRETL